MQSNQHDKERRPTPAGATIRVRLRYPASPSQVFDAWLDPAVARHWLFATAAQPLERVRIDARVAGRFQLAERTNGNGAGASAVYTGRYTEIRPPRRLAFTLRDQHGATSRVAVDIVARRGGCELSLRHERVPAERVQRVEERWLGSLYGLGEALAMVPVKSRSA